MNVSVLESPLGARWTTLAMGLVIVLVVGVYKRRPYLAVAATMGWVTTFEALFQLTDILAKGKGLHAFVGESWWLWTVIGWSFLSLALGILPSWRWSWAFVIVFVLWIGQGFGYNWPGQTVAVNWWFEALNVTSKTLLGIAFLVGAWRAAERENYEDALQKSAREHVRTMSERAFSTPIR